MTAESVSTTPPGRLIRPPGVYVDDGVRAGPGAPNLLSGVPAFVGFAHPKARALGRGGVAAVVIERWDAREFDESIDTAPPSFLRMAVHGFFANGGKRCVVLAVPPPQAEGDGTAGLVDALNPGGPLADRSDIDLVCVPDAVSSLVRKDGGLYEVHKAALLHCEAMGDRFAILDAPDIRPTDAQDAVGAVLRLSSSLRSASGALYFPWIAVDRARDGFASAVQRTGCEEWRCLPPPVRRGEPGAKEFMPPCGHVAGLFARIDELVGPQRSPANEMLEGVVDTSIRLTATQHALLNEGGVNCLRNLRGRGIEVGGARTLSGHALWAYISTARVILGFRRWLAVGMRDFVFEPQTTTLWDSIRIRLVSHCLDLLGSGALAGSNAAQAFFVKCDGETNPPDERDLGRVVAHVGLAPSVPAEFIVVRIVHDASGFTVSGLAESL